MRSIWCAVIVALLAPGAPGADGQSRPRPTDSIERLERGSFLVASRALRDPNFSETVVVVVQHEPRRGALGLVINRPSAVELSRVFTGADAVAEGAEAVFVGGPVEPLQFTMLVRSPEPIERAEPVFEDVYFSSNLDLLEGLARSGDRVFRAYAGYAGWAAGQLEAEIESGGWHVIPGRADTLFEHSTDEIWPRLILVGTAEWARHRGEVVRRRLEAGA